MFRFQIIVILGMLLVLAGCATERTSRTRPPIAEKVIASSARVAPSEAQEEFRSRFPDAELVSVVRATYKDGSEELVVEYLQDGEARNASIIVTPNP